MASQFRNNKLVTASITPAAREGLDILSEHYKKVKVSRAIDTIIKEHMKLKGYKEQNMVGSIDVSLIIGSKSIEKHSHDQNVYFEAPDSGAYTIVIENNNAYRKEVAVSVDGLSVMNGEDASYETRGYIIPGYSSISISGWRRDYDKVASFEFSDSAESYSSKIGKGDNNVGVIGVAVFKEKSQHNYWALSTLAETLDKKPDHLYGNVSSDIKSESLGARRISSSDKFVSSKFSKGIKKIGTSYGKESDMKVVGVDFERDSESPETVNIYNYASRKSLLKLGVIKEQVSMPDPFPGNKASCKAPSGWKS